MSEWCNQRDQWETDSKEKNVERKGAEAKIPSVSSLAQKTNSQPCSIFYQNIWILSCKVSSGDVAVTSPEIYLPKLLKGKWKLVLNINYSSEPHDNYSEDNPRDKKCYIYVFSGWIKQISRNVAVFLTTINIWCTKMKFWTLYCIHSHFL